MPEMEIDFPINLEKINPKSGLMRRFSTGNAIIKLSEPKHTPNYHRASSIGSCHDFCKYGAKRGFPPESISSKQNRTRSLAMEARSETNCRGNKFLGKKKIPPVSSSRQLQPSELKPKPLVRSDQSAVKQLNKTSLKTTKNDRICQNQGGKDIIRSVPSFFSRSSVSAPSVKIRTAKIYPEKDTHLETKKSVANSETYDEDVPEKIIHVIEPEEENRTDYLGRDHGNQKQKLDSSAKSRIEKVVPKENESSSRKLKIIKRGKAQEIENGGAGSKGISLRRVVSDGGMTDREKTVSMTVALLRKAIEQKETNPDSMNAVIEETASKLCCRSKVKALVNAFETLISIQDSDKSSSAHTRSVRPRGEK